MDGERLRDMRHPPKDSFFLSRWLAQFKYAMIAAFFNVCPLPQKAKYRESFRFAGELADHGYSVLIFPEGRRTETGELGTFRSGIGLLATHLNLPVIPMRIDGLFPLRIAKKHSIPRDGFRAAAEVVEVFWFAGHFEMAAAGEVAGDIFFTD